MGVFWFSQYQFAMGKRIDLTGQKFGFWNVIRPAVFVEGKGLFWWCRCDCGTEQQVYGGGLRFGENTSCGCKLGEDRRRQRIAESKFKHGMSHSPEATAYANARTRCTNPSDPETWKNYGGRGLEFRFNSFEEFFACVGPRPTRKHTLDRIDNDGHYEAGNVRWASREEQQANKRRLDWLRRFSVEELLRELDRQLSPA
jgi:hypothetical protein